MQYRCLLLRLTRFRRENVFRVSVTTARAPRVVRAVFFLALDVESVKTAVYVHLCTSMCVLIYLCMYVRRTPCCRIQHVLVYLSKSPDRISYSRKKTRRTSREVLLAKYYKCDACENVNGIARLHSLSFSLPAAFGRRAVWVSLPQKYSIRVVSER